MCWCVYYLQVLWDTESEDSFRYMTSSLLNVLRQDQENYLKLFDYFGPAVVGAIRWRHLHVSQVAFSNIISPSDEAFLLLCLQSYKEKWIHNIHETVRNDMCCYMCYSSLQTICDIN